MQTTWPRSLYRLSPSSRRAWIEIIKVNAMDHKWIVALLAEGVDRNPETVYGPAFADVALLAEGVDRNSQRTYRKPVNFVALLAEGVDRNKERKRAEKAAEGRPPRGGRG